jgi:hypothetical protein
MMTCAGPCDHVPRRCGSPSSLLQPTVAPGPDLKEKT